MLYGCTHTKGEKRMVDRAWEVRLDKKKGNISSVMLPSDSKIRGAKKKLVKTKAAKKATTAAKTISSV